MQVVNLEHIINNKWEHVIIHSWRCVFAVSTEELEILTHMEEMRRKADEGKLVEPKPTTAKVHTSTHTHTHTHSRTHTHTHTHTHQGGNWVRSNGSHFVQISRIRPDY